jgi:predicted phosphohydrolase
MSIYAISDLHLSFSNNKPMDIFGSKWTNYEEKIRQNWIDKVAESDTVIIAGDFSWATYLEDTINDFKFLNDLPGKKILLKGNHDYWWTTASKMNKFIEENNFKNIYFLQNNFFECEGYLICGTRYWAIEDSYDNDKIFAREIERLKLSIKYARIFSDTMPIIIVTHYPPDAKIIEAVTDYSPVKWIYGHIHNNFEDRIKKLGNIECFLTSSDFLEFDVQKINASVHSS